MQFWELPGLTGDSLRVALGSRLNCLKPLIACKSVGSRWAYNPKVEGSNPPCNQSLQRLTPDRAEPCSGLQTRTAAIELRLADGTPNTAPNSQMDSGQF